MEQGITASFCRMPLKRFSVPLARPQSQVMKPSSGFVLKRFPELKAEQKQNEEKEHQAGVKMKFCLKTDG